MRFPSSDNSRAKQFRDLCGKPVYIWSLCTLAAHPKIDLVIVVVAPESIAFVKEELPKYLNSNALSKISLAAGGSSRQESVFNGLTALEQLQPEFVLIHDAARPFLTHSLIDANLDKVFAHGACTTAIPATDTVKRVEDGLITQTIDRSELFMIQTPQAARFDWLLSAHRKALMLKLSTTDDAAILEAQGYHVAIAEGSPFNLKITKQADFRICESLAKLFEDNEIGYD